jgi:hypothetical protein
MKTRGRAARTRAGVGWCSAQMFALALGSLIPLRAATDFAKYHTYEELSAALKSAVSAHADLARIESIGRTKEGREIWAVEIGSRTGTAIDSRPALLIAANFEGDHVIGSQLALYTIDFLLNAYPTDTAVKQRLDHSVIYVVPRVNPDGAEQMFAPVKALRRGNATPFDADNDGRTDEDGPEDLNNDGVITVMRVKDPKGPYMIHPDHRRLMKRADPAKGESGGWALHPEGIDNDGDGFINEDGPGGVDLNRNFMHQYPYFGADAGRYMASETETRAMLDYVLKHRNIAAILSFGESDNLIAAAGRAGTAAGINLIDFAESSNAGARRVGMMPDFGAGRGGAGGAGGTVAPAASADEGAPAAREGETPAAARGGAAPAAAGTRGGATPAAGARGAAASATAGRGPGIQPATTVNAADAEYLNTIATKYRELTGLTSTGFTRAPAGAFYEYGYFQYGVPSFSTPGWGLPGGTPPATAGGAAPDAETIAQPATPPTEATAGRAATGGQRGATAGRGAGAGRGPARGGTGAAASTGGPAAANPEGIDLRLLRWMESEKIDGFVDWTPFKHPKLGDVEIGGFKPYMTVNPPAEKIADLGASHAKFVIYLTSLFPKIAIAKSEVTALGGGIYRIKAEIENTGYLPTALAHGVAARAVKPVMVQLGVPPESILTGAEKNSFIPALAGSGNRTAFEWVIKGNPGASIPLKVVSQKSGTDTATLLLK